MTFDCPLCHQPVDPDARGTMQRVVGWQQKAGTRESGKHGGSDIYMRRTMQEFAHAYCVRLARDGHLGQEALLDA
jgi:hypothetical protein